MRDSFNFVRAIGDAGLQVGMTMWRVIRDVSGRKMLSILEFYVVSFKGSYHDAMRVEMTRSSSKELATLTVLPFFPLPGCCSGFYRCGHFGLHTENAAE